MHTRVALDMTTMTIMRILPREVDPVVHKMLSEDPGEVDFTEIGGLSEQIRELREVSLLRTKWGQRIGKWGISLGARHLCG